MKELVLISGKGGTGKTTLTAAFAYLARNKVLADCDVDAPDLHILALPEIIQREDFRGGIKAYIDVDKCIKCGACIEGCRFNAISDEFHVNPLACEGCGVCFHLCPESAITLKETVNGTWYISQTRFGPMVHASLFPGEENSGKLVALVRNQAKVLAGKRQSKLILVDGAPGVGCPVISSVTGADHVIIVTEPTLSGLHDMERALQLVQGFRIPASVIINKWDINPDVAERIEELSKKKDANVLGRIPYDPQVVKALVQLRCVVENGTSPAANSIREIWERLETDSLTE
ncbi:MAG: ATP-binding protein [Desulfomonilaceae bacterium]